MAIGLRILQRQLNSLPLEVRGRQILLPHNARVGAFRSHRHARSRALRRHTRDEAGTPELLCVLPLLILINVDNVDSLC